MALPVSLRPGSSSRPPRLIPRGARLLAHLAVGLTLMASGFADRQACAHPDLEASIEAARTNDSSARAWLRRGELRRIAGDRAGAESDYARAAALEPGLPEILFCRGALLLDAGRAVGADSLLSEYLNLRAGDARALLLRARVRETLGRPEAALADFDRAIATGHAAAARPDAFLARARLASTLGAGDVSDALAGLDRASNRIGVEPSLTFFAIELELRRGAYPAALERLERIERVGSPAGSTAGSRATLLARRGDILAASGRSLEAEAAWSEALSEIEQSPTGAGRTPALTALAARLRLALSRPRGERP